MGTPGCLGRGFLRLRLCEVDYRKRVGSHFLQLHDAAPAFPPLAHVAPNFYEANPALAPRPLRAPV